MISPPGWRRFLAGSGMVVFFDWAAARLSAL